MTKPRPTAGTWGWRFFLAALAAVLGVLLGATTVSATVSAAETRVGAIPVTTPVTVGFDTGIWASQHQVNAPPQTETVSATGVATKAVSKFGSLTHASSGIAPFSTQRLVAAGQGGAIQAHHLIERRFAATMGQSVDDMASIVVTRAEHQVFTNAWRAEIPYGSRNVTPSQVNTAATRVYADYPEILQALGLG